MTLIHAYMLIIVNLLFSLCHPHWWFPFPSPKLPVLTSFSVALTMAQWEHGCISVYRLHLARYGGKSEQKLNLKQKPQRTTVCKLTLWLTHKPMLS